MSTHYEDPDRRLNRIDGRLWSNQPIVEEVHDGAKGVSPSYLRRHAVEEFIEPELGKQAARRRAEGEDEDETRAWRERIWAREMEGD